MTKTSKRKCIRRCDAFSLIMSLFESSSYGMLHNIFKLVFHWQPFYPKKCTENVLKIVAFFLGIFLYNSSSIFTQHLVFLTFYFNLVPTLCLLKWNCYFATFVSVRWEIGAGLQFQGFPPIAFWETVLV